MAQAENDQLRANDRAAFEEEFHKLTMDSKELKVFIGIAQMALGAFGYGTGPFDGTMDDKTTSAIQQYQKHRGLKVTTKLDAATVKTLFEDFDEWMKQIPYLPPLAIMIDDWDIGYVKVEGTWVIEQDQMAFPMQTSQIQCDRASKECVSGTARWTGKNLTSNIEKYVIETWNTHEIVMVSKDDQCVRSTMRVLKAQTSVTASQIKIDGNGFCKEITPELRLRLEDGMKVHKQLSNEREEQIKKFLRLPLFISDRNK